MGGGREGPRSPIGHNVAGNDRADSLASRGTTIITQKENKGEYNGIQCWNNNGSRHCDGAWYNSNWQWSTISDRDIYVHVVDQNGKKGTTNGVPIRYASNTANYQTTDNIPQCTSDCSTTSGDTLYSGTRITSQKSCNPNTLNAGNWYSFPAATAGSNNASTSTATNMPNSICPKGWRLPLSSGNKSFNTLIRTAYNISSATSDSGIINSSAMSFVRLGHYDPGYGSLNSRGDGGRYWSSTAYSSADSHGLYFGSWYLNPQNGYDRALGLSVRCVSR